MNNPNQNKVWVTGGYFDSTGECFIFEIDFFSNQKNKIIRYIPPEDLLVPRKGFTGAVWCGVPGKSDLLVCGYCALYRFSPPDWKITGTLHQPCMNDLHHVNLYKDNIYLVNTGLDTIDVFDITGHFKGNFTFQPGWINNVRQEGITPSVKQWKELTQLGWNYDLRNRQITDSPPEGGYYESNKCNFHQKPIRDFVHLNHVTVLNNEILATSLNDRCIYKLSEYSKIIQNLPSHPHDGLISDDKLWFTCIDGTILAYKIKNGIIGGEEDVRINLFDHTEHHGWCRGIMIKGKYLLIGITEIREKPPYKWDVSELSKTETGVICWDICQSKVVNFTNLTDVRHSKVFSIIDAGR